MKYVEVIVEAESADTISQIAEKHAMIVYIFGWSVTFIVLVLFIYTRRSLAV